ncbi:hypothetical protein [Burkholderia vietnamiensis]|uniref:hypothetical protein n=1 Tax=Burkholderia vietnamiensis TaxID=60552 RepID=UPI001E589EA6|nr:hypothetical protein [Burkholderia vietnamiensis]
MGFSSRTFLVAPDDTLWRLSTSKFDRMLRNPASHRLPAFAGQRARMASVVVELVASEPTRVIRTTYSVLAFDAEGRIDPGRFEEQQFALAESVVAPSSLHPRMGRTNLSSTRQLDSSRKGAVDSVARPGARD